MGEEALQTVVTVAVVGVLLVGVVAGACQLAVRYPRYVIAAQRQHERVRARRRLLAAEELARVSRELERWERRGQLSTFVSDGQGRVSVAPRKRSADRA